MKWKRDLKKYAHRINVSEPIVFNRNNKWDIYVLTVRVIKVAIIQCNVFIFSFLVLHVKKINIFQIWINLNETNVIKGHLKVHLRRLFLKSQLKKTQTNIFLIHKYILWNLNYVTWKDFLRICIFIKFLIFFVNLQNVERVLRIFNLLYSNIQYLKINKAANLNFSRKTISFTMKF